MLKSTKSTRQAEECLASTGSTRCTSGLYQVNCDMEGGHKGGWTTIVKIDASKGDSCPSAWTRISASGKVVCRSGSNSAGCYSAIFTTYNVTFNKICGQIKGYQKGTPDAFHSTKYDTMITM